jgi:arginase family enzyme
MIHFDVDLDCDMISYGTGTPVKDLTSNEVIEIINQIIKSRKVVCFEVVEVNSTAGYQRKQDGRNGFSGFGAKFHTLFYL